jgi:hypothetical protein
MEECNFCHKQGHRIHLTDARGVYLKDDKGNRILACPVLKTREQEAWPALSGNVQPRSEARELARKQRIKEEKHRRQVAWKEQQKKKALLLKSKEEAHVAAMTEKYGKFWHRAVAYSSDDCDTALNIRITEACDLYYEEERAFKEEAARWYKEDDERKKRRANMTKEEKQQEEEDWDDAIESAYEKEQDAADYLKMTGVRLL